MRKQLNPIAEELQLSRASGEGRGGNDTAADAGAATTAEIGGGASVPPTGNTGDTQSPLPGVWRLVATGTGEFLEIPIRRGYGGSAAFIDWVNFTFHRDTCDQYADFLSSNDDYVLALSRRLESIFGFGVTAKRKSGLYHFSESFELGNKWGMVLIGGQRGRMMVSLSGEGCAAAREGWEKRLYDFLTDEAEEPRISRADCAYDDYTGQLYTVDRAVADDDADLFRNPRAPESPQTEQVGAWRRNQWKGRTFTVGMRTSDKFLRIYERGRKLGDHHSEWNRIEGEFKAKQTIIPFDILLKPGAYLAAMYPALSWISEEQKRPETVQKAYQITFDAAERWFTEQCGHYLKTFLEVRGIDYVMQNLTRDEIPRRLQVPHYSLSPEPMKLEDKHSGHDQEQLLNLAVSGQLPSNLYGPTSFKLHPGINPAVTLRDRVRIERKGAGYATA